MKNLSEALMKSKRLDIVKTFLDFPKKEWSIKELSEKSGVSYSTTHRFVKVLEKNGMIKSVPRAYARLLTLNKKSPYLSYMRNMLKLEIEPLLKIARRFVRCLQNRIAPMKSIIAFGSVVRGSATAESDIDVLVLSPAAKNIEDKVHSQALEFSKQVGRNISPIVVDYSEFKQDIERGENFAKSVEESHKILFGEDPWKK